MPRAMEEKFHAALRPYPPAGRYLVAVSGGRDSVALLHLLLEQGYHRLIVCHLDHGLRGDESAADARFVETLANTHGLPSETARADVAALARAGKQSLETAGREARYRFFAGIARRRRCWTLLLGHHADDRVETLLFNLLRGTGLAGLSTMRPVSWRWVDQPGAGACALQIARPLLDVWRVEIDAFLAARGLPWREDASNLDPAHTRNRLRAEALPMLAQVFGREVKAALWRSADLLAAEETWLRDLSRPEIELLPAELPVPALRAHPVALQRRVLRAWLQGTHGIPGVGYREVEAVRALLSTAPRGSAKVNLPGGRWGRRRRGTLFVENPREPGIR